MEFSCALRLICDRMSLLLTSVAFGLALGVADKSHRTSSDWKRMSQEVHSFYSINRYQRSFTVFVDLSLRADTFKTCYRRDLDVTGYNFTFKATGAKLFNATSGLNLYDSSDLFGVLILSDKNEAFQFPTRYFPFATHKDMEGITTEGCPWPLKIVWISLSNPENTHLSNEVLPTFIFKELRRGRGDGLNV